MEANVLLSSFCHKTHQDRERLKELSRFVEQSLRAEHTRRKDRATEELEGITDESEAMFIAECHAEDIFQVERDFPRVQRYALFVSMMGMLEANIVGLCRVAHRIFCIPKEFNAYSQVVAQGVAYLENKAGINTSRFHSRIEFVRKLNSLRNCIAHAEGSLKNRHDAKVIKEFVKNIPTVELDNQERLVLMEGFVGNTAYETHILLDRLHDALKSESAKISVN